MTDTVDDTPVADDATTQDDSQVVADLVGGEPTETPTEEPTGAERPDWLLDKYATEGKSFDEATSEQAKAYKELSGKFGAFTGAPDSYEVSLSDELKDSGIEMDSEDPMVVAAMEFAKNSNMDQGGFNDMMNLYAMQKVAENTAQTEYQAEQMKALGPQAQSRLSNIDMWVDKNVDAETAAGLKGMATGADSVKALERLISMTRSSSVDAIDTTATSNASVQEVQKMQFEKDSNGERRINTDPAFKAEYIAKRNQVYGTDEHRVMVG